METILVTGALGTLGRWTVEELAGSYRVIGVDLHEPETTRDRPVSYLAGDLTDQGTAWELVVDLDPDAVVHLAAVPGAGHRTGTETFRTNVLSTYNVLTAAGHAGLPVVWSSSEATYGVTFRDQARPLSFLPVDESHPQRPEDGYGLSKVVGEQIATRTHRRFGVPVASLQPSWIQVPGQYETATVRESFDAADPTPSGSLWSYVDVRDVARLVRRALETDIDGHERYIAAATDNYIDAPTAGAIEAAWGTLPRDCSLADDEAGFSTAKARRELDWTPRHSWREAETADVPHPEP